MTAITRRKASTRTASGEDAGHLFLFNGATWAYLYDIYTWYAEHRLPIFGQLRPGGFKGGYATTYCGCLAAPIGVLCLVVYMVDLLRRSVWSASVASTVECWFGSRFGEARIG